MKGLKLGIGVVLLVLSVAYIGVISVVVSERKSQAENISSSFLEFTYVGCENLGSVIETKSGDTLEALEGYVYYRLLFDVKNRSYAEDWSDPGDRIYLSSKSYHDVEEIFHDPEWDYDYDKLFYDAARAMLPGKACVSTEVYVMVREGTKEVWVYYYPNWDVDEEEISLSLDQYAI